MPRPKLVSDTDVLEGTRRVMLRQGSGFTLSDVAGEVGLSRAALIQRFDNKAGLATRLSAHQLAGLQQLVTDYPVPNKGPRQLLPFLDQTLETFDLAVLLAGPETAALLRRAIVDRLDEPSRQRATEVADLLMTLLAGAASEGGRDHVAARLRLGLKLIYAGRPA